MSIDPYHPLLAKHSKLLEENNKSLTEIEPIASLDNMEHFRDSSFDFKGHFGIHDLESDVMK
jgi:hypothetical protein